MPDFSSVVLRTVSGAPAAAMLTRISGIAAVAADNTRHSAAARALLDGLREQLRESLQRATVRGAPMYSDDGATLDRLADTVVARLKRGPYTKPQEIDLERVVETYVYEMTAAQRVELILNGESHGPLLRVGRGGHRPRVCVQRIARTLVQLGPLLGHIGRNGHDLLLQRQR